jgi:hypothetical protein
MQQRLFRQVALERLSSPERLDELMEVTTPKTWLALLGVGALIAAAIVWGIYGRVPTFVKGQGVLIREGSLQAVETPAAGELRDLLVAVGDEVLQEQVVARIVQAPDSRTVVVTSPHAGRVLELRATQGNLVSAGTPLLSLEQPGRPLEGVLYLPPTEAKKVRPGMEAQLSPASVKREEYGLLLGQVIAVGAYPATPAGMKRVLGSEELVKTLSASGPPVEVRVELARAASTTSGYQWTSTLSTLGMFFAALLPDALVDALPTWASAPGPPIALASGTLSTADIITEQQAPINLVLAKVNR